MTRDEAHQIEEAMARVVAEERRRVRFEFSRALEILRTQIAAAETELRTLRKDFSEARNAVDDAGDHGTLDNVAFLHRKGQR